MLENFVNILLIVLGFGVLIFIHELGHFLAAKWAGVRTEAFAIGMFHCVVSWRKGIGFALGSTHRKVVEKTGKTPLELNDEDLQRHRIGETEYSLRWLPIGGFVKMLGQDDVNPAAVSDHPRSFNVCPISKRMVIISAGVIANIALAVVLFVVAFMVGVRMEAPTIGMISASLPAGRTVADNADALRSLGTEPRLQPGDTITSIDGDEVKTFADVQIASAMSKPDTALLIEARRAGIDEPLRLTMTPEKDAGTGLLSIGVAPAASSRLWTDNDETLAGVLTGSPLVDRGLRSGMAIVAADGELITTYQQFDSLVQASGGTAVATVWRAVDDRLVASGPSLEMEVPVEPRLSLLFYDKPGPELTQHFESGLVGLSPLVRIAEITKGSQNESILRTGDVVLAAGRVKAPRMGEFRREVGRNKGGVIELELLRDGRVFSVEADVDRSGMVNVLPGYAIDTPMIARPFEMTGPAPGSDEPARPTAVADLQLLGRTTLLALNDDPISDWRTFRALLRKHTETARVADTDASVVLTIQNPTPGAETEMVKLRLSVEDVRELHALGFSSILPEGLFEPVFAIRDAGGSPLKAAAMGFEETHKFIMLTYLTLDRLIRGSVGVKQIHGPVGIVHVGSKIADRGFMYLIFFLGLISVNLAVINFLPLPIVDGGLFLFLIYEKLKGRPPSIAFQNAATLAGVALIGTVLLVVTWNDVVRLLT